jgi:hypothetical protein
MKARRKFYEALLLDKSVIERYVCNRVNDTLLKEAQKYCYIPVKDVDDLRKKIQEPNFLSIERASRWKKSTIPVLNYDGNTYKYSYYRANYNIVNKWGHKDFYKCFQIIYSDDFIVRWFGCNEHEKLFFWVSDKKTIYRINYRHKLLYLYPSACGESESESVRSLDTTLFDNLVKKYEEKFSNYFYTDTAQRIELGQYFKKGFFYKGPKYDFKNQLPRKENISEIIDVKAENGLFRIEIKNKTYPHSGYAYLDLAKLEITHTELKS